MGKKALFAGSFDPLTNGHLDTIIRGAHIADELVVGIIRNPQKKGLFTEGEKKQMIEEVTKDYDNITVDVFDGLLADYVNENGYDMVVRGLRNTADFDNEISMAQLHKVLYNDGVETVFLMTNPEYAFISSTMVKEVYGLGGDVSRLVPPQILDFMNKKFDKEK